MHLSHLHLVNYKNYPDLEINLVAGINGIVGPNGAGKTNLLEALSLFTPGRGLRGATVPEMGRRAPGEATRRARAGARFSSEKDWVIGGQSSPVLSHRPGFWPNRPPAALHPPLRASGP